MATKRGGGSNIGLIVTLVFFVLLSVIVSVLAYMGFDGQAKLKTDKDAAETKEKNADKKMRWYRFQAHLYRSYMGHPVSGEALTQLKNNKAQFDGGTFPDADGQDDKADVEKLNKETLGSAMPWDAEKSDSPDPTFEKRLQAKDTMIGALTKSADNALAAQKAAEDAKTKAESDKAAAEGQRDKIVKSNKDDRDDYQKFASDANSRIDANLVAAKDRDDLRGQKDAVEKDKDKLARAIKTLQGRVDKASQDLKTARDELDEAKTRLAAVADKAGIDTRVMTAEMFDAKATQLLKAWDRNWQIVAMDRKGTMPYINLGTSDGLKEQVTFSIHSVGTDGKLNPTPKGTLEVVRVIGAKQAQARITSLKDAKKDPVLKGDRLFNATWDPSRQKHVAIAGLADLGGDGTDNTDDMRRLLARQSVVLDAYVDTKDEKAPKIEGKGITNNTDYLILGESLEAVNHPKYRDAKYSKEFADLVKKLKDQAAANGVTVLPLRKYLDLIGYRAPKVVTSGAGR